MEKYDVTASLRGASYPPRKLLAIYGGVLALFFLICAAVGLGLNAVNIKGGLDTITLQAFLTTAQLALPLAGAVLLPGWMAGLRCTALGILRGEKISPRSLTAGFAKLLPLLTSLLMMGLQYALRGYISLSIASSLLTFTPAGSKLYDAAQNMTDTNLATVLGEDYLWVMSTLFVITAILFLIISLPVFYRYRMTGYLIADRQEPGGGRAMVHSRMIMFRRYKELARLDLRFWWYYLLLLLGITLSAGGWIADLVGLSLPISRGVLSWVCPVIGGVLLFAVQVLAGPRVAVTYAQRYEHYLQTPPPPPPEPKKPQVNPQDLPWQY